MKWLDIATNLICEEENNFAMVNLKQGHRFLNQVNIMLHTKDAGEKCVF